MSADNLNPLDEIRSTPIPETLWHYTSLGALKGIVENGTIWATDIRYLNDTKEFVHALDLIEEEAEKLSDPSVIKLITTSARFAMQSGELSPNSINLYVVSFSAARDRLSQWRSYTEQNRGVSIGFNMQSYHSAPLQSSSIDFGPCIYDDNQKRDLIRNAIKHIQEEYAVLVEEVQNGTTKLAAQNSSSFDNMENEITARMGEAYTRMIQDLFRCVPFLKHTSFEEESEWRLVLEIEPRSMPHGKLKIRTGKSALVPYVEHQVGPTNGSPITHVIVGPTPMMERSKDSIKLLLDSRPEWNPSNSVTITESGTSFRSW